jgi:hypothetical protein
MPRLKKKKMTLLTEHIASLNHWRNELLSLDKKYFNKDLEKERTIKNMINKCLDDIIEFNKLKK